MTRIMYDSTTAADLPDGGDLYAGYVDGRYRNIDQVRSRFPGKPVVTITVFGGDANVVDVEAGNPVTPEKAVDWVLGQRAKGQRPTVYTLDSQWARCRSAFQVRNVPEPLWWIAHYDGVVTLPAGAVAKQYGGDTPGHYDISIVADFWPGVDPEPVQSSSPPKEPDMHRRMEIVQIPPPDPKTGLQLQSRRASDNALLGDFGRAGAVSIKANNDGHPVAATVQSFEYLGCLILSFRGDNGKPVPSGLVAIIWDETD